MSDINLIATIACNNTLGEGIQWNAQDQAFWWTDIHGQHLYRYALVGAELQSWVMPERLACFAFAYQDKRLLAAFASGIAWFDLATGEREWLAKPEAHLPGNRSNDGRCDRQGRFWMGSIVEQPGEPCANLYSLSPQGQLACHLSHLRISNALCWSPDSRQLYHADSPSHCIQVYDFDAESGSLANGRVFATTEAGVEPDAGGRESAALSSRWRRRFGYYPAR